MQTMQWSKPITVLSRQRNKTRKACKTLLPLSQFENSVEGVPYPICKLCNDQNQLQFCRGKETRHARSARPSCHYHSSKIVFKECPIQYANYAMVKTNYS